MTAQLRELFPSLADFSVTSPQDLRYNCVAWAVGTDEGWWWPTPGFEWPFNRLEDEELATFTTAFNTLGYERCADGTLEDGFEKIAIYQSTSGEVSHVARQSEYRTLDEQTRDTGRYRARESKRVGG